MKMNRLIAKAHAEMSGNFGRYKREGERAVRTIEVKETRLEENTKISETALKQIMQLLPPEI